MTNSPALQSAFQRLAEETNFQYGSRVMDRARDAIAHQLERGHGIQRAAVTSFAVDLRQEQGVTVGDHFFQMLLAPGIPVPEGAADSISGTLGLQIPLEIKNSLGIVLTMPRRPSAR